MKRPTALIAAAPRPGTMSGLVVLVLELADDREIAGAGIGPEVLPEPLLVVRDDGVRDREDALRRAVVLLQSDDLGVGEVLLEVKDVAYVGAPEAVHRLV